MVIILTVERCTRALLICLSSDINGRLFVDTFHTAPAVAILIPSLAEGKNVIQMLRGADELAAALPHLKIGVLYVDDTPPGTEHNDVTGRRVAEAKHDLHLPHLAMIELEHRIGREKWGGLGGAVVHGFERLKELGYSVALVMDGDGQHSFQTAHAMLERMVAPSGALRYDLVNGSRKVEGGTNAGLDGSWRQFVSWAGKAASKGAFPHALRDVTDPMSGCFAVRLDRVDCSLLQQVNGFKILLELVLTHTKRIRRISEVAMIFLKREEGQSKASAAHGKALGRQLLRLRRNGWPDWVNFGCGALVAYLVGAGVLELLVLSGANQVTAYRCSLLVSLYVNIRYNWKHTFRAGGRQRWKKPFMWLSRIAVILVSERVTVGLIIGGYHHQTANAIGVLAGGLLNFALTYIVLSQGGEATGKGKRRASRRRAMSPAAYARANLPTQRSASHQDRDKV